MGREVMGDIRSSFLLIYHLLRPVERSVSAPLFFIWKKDNSILSHFYMLIALLILQMPRRHSFDTSASH